MIKMIVSDLDGTLLAQGESILEQDKDAIRNVLKANGDLQLCIASGRMDIEIKKILNSIGESGHRISQNGGFIYFANGGKFKGNVFSSKLAQEIYEFLPKNDVSLITLFSEDNGFIKEKSELISSIEEELFFPLEIEPDLYEKIEQMEVSKITIGGETNYLKALEKQVRENYMDKVDTFISDPHCLDIMPKNISKGNSLRQLIHYLNIKPSEIACIGDSYNDISMFDLTPHSYSMSHAESEVKKSANHVVEHVSDMIEHLIEQGYISKKTLK